MKKYLWLIFIFAFVGMKAESGWEDFGTYQKQNLIIPKLLKFQISADSKQFFTCHQDSLIRKWDLETGVLLDSIKFDVSPQFISFSSEGTSALILNKYTNYDKPTELLIFDMETMAISKSFSFVPNSGILIPKGYYIQSFSFELIDFNKKLEEILMSYSGSYWWGDQSGGYSHTDSRGRSVIISIDADTLNLKAVFSLNRLKYFKIIDNDYYFIESAYSSSWKNNNNQSSSSSSSINVFDYSNLTERMLLNYSESSYIQGGVKGSYGYLPSVSGIFPTVDSNVFLVKIDKKYLKYDSLNKKFIDSFQVDSYYSIDYPMNEKQNLICYDSAKFKIYNIKSQIKSFSFSCPINAIGYKILPDENRIISWNAFGEVALQNIYPAKVYTSIIANKYYENPDKEIRFSYFGNLKAESYFWDFGDGNNSTENSPIHNYLSKGVYKVKLEIKTLNGQKSIIEIDKPIIIKDKLKANFEVLDYSKKSPTNVYFKDISKGEPNSYTWITSQNDTSSFKNPFFIFTKSGYFSVKLIITDEFQTDSISKEDIINIDYTKIDSLIQIAYFNLPSNNEYYYPYSYGIDKALELNFYKSVDDAIIVTDKFRLWAFDNVNHDTNYSIGQKAYLLPDTNKFTAMQNQYFPFKFNLSFESFIITTNSTFTELILTDNKFVKKLKKISLNEKIENVYYFENYIYTLTASSINIFNLDLDSISKIDINQKPFHLVNATHNSIKAVINRSDSLFLIELENNIQSSEKYLLALKEFENSYNFNNLDNNKFAFLGSLLFRGKKIGIIKLFDNNGNFIRDFYITDIEEIYEIGRTDDDNYFLRYKSSKVGEASIIILNQKLDMISKYIFNNYDTNFVIHNIHYYKKNQFIVGGFVNGTIIQTSIRLLQTSNGALNVPEPIIPQTSEISTVFPNPATDLLYLNFEFLESSFRIYNQIGMEVDNGLLNKNYIDIQKLPIGSYYLIITKNNQIYKQLFIKN